MDPHDALLLGELERAYLSEVIHDDVLQTLGASVLIADTCEQAWRFGRTDLLEGQFARLRMVLEQASGRLRQLMTDLRPLDPEHSLETALNRVAISHGPFFAGPVSLNLDIDAGLTVSQRILTYRSVLDALHCLREPSLVSALRIEVRSDAQNVKIEVCFDATAGHAEPGFLLASKMMGFLRWRTASQIGRAHA